MRVFINKNPHELAEGATLVDAIAAIQAKPPFAAAVNTQFVPNTEYTQHRLQAEDRIDIISPVTGG
jgi:sulfur carrier protein